MSKNQNEIVFKDKHGYTATLEQALCAIELERHNFEADGNPCHVWGAVELITRLGTPFPSWVRDYLRKTSSNILDCENAKGLNDALGFQPRQMGKNSTNELYGNMAMFVRRELEKGHSKGIAIEKASEHFVASEKTIEKACGEYSELIYKLRE